MSVRAFQPRKSDPPQFVAEDVEELEGLVGSFVGAEQCDSCGNHTYRIDNIFFAVCATDPNEDPEFRHPEPCGTEYPINVWDDELVVF